MKTIKLFSYNIHKGFTAGKRNFVLKKIKDAISNLDLDVACLQEVIGHHDRHATLNPDWKNSSQFEYLASAAFSHYAYGKNAIYPTGNHGNAILSRHPISFSENEDVSFSRIERRGLLHTVLDLPEGQKLHVFCVHLGLFENDRRTQFERLAQRISNQVPPDAPLIIAGDFNDWRENASEILERSLGVKEASFSLKKRHALTFPAFFPLFALDRIYYRNMKCVSAHTLANDSWPKLSDHLPLQGIFEI